MSDIDPGIDPELKQRWLEALTSGEYLHSTGELHNDTLTRHCCLGVLCLIDNRFVGDPDTNELTDEECWILGISTDTRGNLVTANDDHTLHDRPNRNWKRDDYDKYPDTVLDIIRELPERALA